MTFSYFKFLLQSSNQHGVHSPFVYQYLTKGLYAKKQCYSKEKSKSLRLILSTITYFNFKSVFTTDLQIKEILPFYFENISINDQHQTYDLIITTDFNDLKKYYDQMDNDSLLIIVNSKKHRKEVVLANEYFTLTLDFYHTVVLSKRKEQKREVFHLRY